MILTLDPDVTAIDDTRDWLAGITVWQIVIVVTALIVVITAIRKITKATAPVKAFLEDWNGEAARPGVPERPGVMTRLASIESYQRDAVTRSEFDTLHAQVQRHELIIGQAPQHTTVNVNPNEAT